MGGFHRIWKDSKNHKAEVLLFSEFRCNRPSEDDSPGGYLPPEDIIFSIFGRTPGMVERDGGSHYHNDSRKKYINALRLALSLLPERRRDILFMKYYKGMENCEIARIIGIDRRAVHQSLVRSIKSLRNFLVDGKAIQLRTPNPKRVIKVDEKDNTGEAHKKKTRKTR